MTDLATERAPSDLERHRAELTGYCYRMLGSAFEAEDAVQETMVRAWRALDRFEGRSSLRSWLYRIATNVCFDLLDGRTRRSRWTSAPRARPRPHRRSAPGCRGSSPSPTAGWCPRAATRPSWARPGRSPGLRRRPPVAAPRQRAVLILRRCCGGSAAEAAELLGTTVAGVNSALQRARATLTDRGLDAADGSRRSTRRSGPVGPLRRHLRALRHPRKLVQLLHDDATSSMPPYPMWWRGPEDIGKWMAGPGRAPARLPAGAGRGQRHARVRPVPRGGPWPPRAVRALHLVDVSGDRIAGVTYFLDTRLFGLFGLPDHLDG